MAGILAGDKVHFLQDPESPEGDILQISNGSGDHIKNAQSLFHGRVYNEWRQAKQEEMVSGPPLPIIKGLC